MLFLSLICFLKKEELPSSNTLYNLVFELQSCVHVVLDFISPESVGESIQLIDEVRLLPENHIAKVKTLEVKILTILIRNAYINH